MYINIFKRAIFLNCENESAGIEEILLGDDTGGASGFRVLQIDFRVLCV